MTVPGVVPDGKMVRVIVSVPPGPSSYCVVCCMKLKGVEMIMVPVGVAGTGRTVWVIVTFPPEPSL